MYILITGGNGFIAQGIKPFLQENGWNVLNPSRQELDVFDKNSVKSFFQQNSIDVVIHTAIKGGRRTIPDSEEIVEYNLQMFFNLVEELQNGNFKKLINLGSGASFDRKQNIYNYDKDFLGKSIPEDYYGYSKYRIEDFICKTELDIFNIRIFGCFGVNEASDRFIHANLLKLISGNDLVVFNDRYMDYIYIDDLSQLIINVLKRSDLPIRDINACYSQKIKLSEIALIICKLEKGTHKIKIGSMTNSYCGKFELEKYSLNENFKGLEKGIEIFYKMINKSKD